MAEPISTAYMDWPHSPFTLSKGCLRDVMGKRKREREKYSPSLLLLEWEDIRLWVATLVVAEGT